MKRPLPCNTFYPHSSQGTRAWLLDSLLMGQAVEESRRGHSIHLWAPGRSEKPIQDYKWRHSNEYPQNLVSGDKIFQDSFKELGSSCTPKQTEDRSSDPWTSRDLSHPCNGNLVLAHAPTSHCYAMLMLFMIAPCITNCLTHFVSARVNKLQHSVPVQQGYIKLQPTRENITHP